MHICHVLKTNSLKTIAASSYFKNVTLHSIKHTKVGEFQLSDLVDKKVLWFKVAMEDSAPVTVRQAAEHLKHKQLSNSKNKVYNFTFTSCSDAMQQHTATLVRAAVNQIFLV